MPRHGSAPAPVSRVGYRWPLKHGRIMTSFGTVVIATGRHVNGSFGSVGDVAPYEARLDAKKLWRTLAIGIVVHDGDGLRSEYIHLMRSLVTAGRPSMRAR